MTFLGLAHIRPYGFDLDRLDGLGGGGMVTYLGLAYILPIQVGWVGWVGWVGGDDNMPWTCIHTTIQIRLGWVGGGDGNVPWTCTHTIHGWGVAG